jgi:GT2 family glycosyltransferase
MKSIPRENLRWPVKVVQIELNASSADRGQISLESYRSLWCLLRLNGNPVSISFWDVEDDDNVNESDLLADGLPDDRTNADSLGKPSFNPSSCEMTVALCTRERPVELRRALQSLLRQSDMDFDLLVVDNAPLSNASKEIVEELHFPRCTYVVEPNKGLSRARNTAVAAVRTEYLAWLDDDEIADTDWVMSIKEGFAHPSTPAAVCGVMLPAELETEAQVRFEQYGGFNKGRGLVAEILHLDPDSGIEPLYPLPAIGSGGNMDFKTAALRSTGPFDQCLGAGTRTHGGEETAIFAILLRSGETILHWPRAIAWHFHRADMPALHKQFYGYSAGLSAFYASMIRSNPRVLFELFALVPHAFRDLKAQRGLDQIDQLPSDFPKTLLRAGRKGLLAGAFAYALEYADARRSKPPSVRD